MTTAIILLVLSLVGDQWVSLLRMNRAAREIEALRRRNEWLETDIVRLGKDLDALATVVAKNADRTARIEADRSPRPPMPFCPNDYIAFTYPKRADEL